MAAKSNETLTLFREAFTATSKLSNEKFGELIRAIFEFKFSGVEYSGADLEVSMAFSFLRDQVERHTLYCQDKAEAAKKREAEKRLNAQKAQKAQDAQDAQCSTPILSNPILSNPIVNPISNNDLEKNGYYEETTAKPTRHRFSPPSAEDVRRYCQSKGYTVDPDRFVDYYTSNGWKVGRNPMKDWKAAVRTWAKKGNGKETPVQYFPDDDLSDVF